MNTMSKATFAAALQSDQDDISETDHDHLPLIDQEVIDQLVHDIGTEASMALIELFKAEALNLVAQIDTALRSEDHARAATKAHGLKGSAATFGARRLSALAIDLETACHRSDHLKSLSLATQLPSILKQSVSELPS